MTPNGTAIRAFRTIRSASLRGLAKQANCDAGFLSLVERGLSGASDPMLRRIANALEVPVAAINREEMS